MSEKTTTYTPEQTAQVIQLYSEGKTAEEIAATVGKSSRSVVAKLAREGVYKAKEPQQPRRRKKSELVSDLATQLGLVAEQLESLEKATHEALELLVSRVKGQ